MREKRGVRKLVHVVLPDQVALVTRLTLRIAGPVLEDSVVNVIGTQLRDLINSG